MSNSKEFEQKIHMLKKAIEEENNQEVINICSSIMTTKKYQSNKVLAKCYITALIQVSFVFFCY